MNFYITKNSNNDLIRTSIIWSFIRMKLTLQLPIYQCGNARTPVLHFTINEFTVAVRHPIVTHVIIDQHWLIFLVHLGYYETVTLGHCLVDLPF